MVDEISPIKKNSRKGRPSGPYTSYSAKKIKQEIVFRERLAICVAARLALQGPSSRKLRAEAFRFF